MSILAPVRNAGQTPDVIYLILGHSAHNYFFFGSSRINTGAVFLRIFTAAFLIFLAPAGISNPTGPISNPAGQSLTNLT